MTRIRSILDVAENSLCSGCGACAGLAPDVVEMVDDLDLGRRPLVGQLDSDRSAELLAVCPGAGLAHDDARLEGPEWVRGFSDTWGPVIGVFEGHAADDDVRRAGSSGGVATALALHLLESGMIHGVLHTAMDPQRPHLNRTVLSTSRAQLLSTTGSRYAPASPAEGLHLIERAPGACMFVGKPCDVAAVQAARRARPELDRRLALVVAFFCAGTPTTRGTLEMLEVMGVTDPSMLQSLRYRGDGWPGDAVALVGRSDGGTEERRLSYEESWGRILQRHRLWRCRVCADHTGEFADVAVGDPWYRPVEPGAVGSSLIMTRTEAGRAALDAATQAGAIRCVGAPLDLVGRSQPNLLTSRGEVWGRIIGSRLAGLPVPRYRNLRSFPTWLRVLGPRAKAQSVFGTTRRVIARRLRRRRPVVRPKRDQP